MSLAVTPEELAAALPRAVRQLGARLELDGGTASGTIQYEPRTDTYPYSIGFRIEAGGDAGTADLQLWSRSRFRPGTGRELVRFRTRLINELEWALAAALARDGNAGVRSVHGADGLLSRRRLPPLDAAIAASLASGPRWGPGHAALAWIAAFGPIVLLVPLVAFVHGVEGVSTLLGESSLGVFVWLVGRRYARARGGWGPAFGLSRPRLADALPAAGFFVLQMVARIIVGAILIAALHGLTAQSASNVPRLQGFPVGLFVEYLLAAVIVAPLVEETQFRGLILRGLMARWSFWPAALVSSVSFGILHSPAAGSAKGAVYLGVIMTLFGLIQCILVRRSGRLFPAMVVHALANALVLGIAVA
ncbi:MAG TPA: type II CAAX endopeptidase family protein [Acidimicrobiales bacterium]|nr:type II CAAX endopeptidase family protein [Acidimicrobiales bacterium]